MPRSELRPQAPLLGRGLDRVSPGRGTLGALLSLPSEDQARLGYGHTLREIAQQPVTWLETADRLDGHAAAIAESLDGIGSVVLTGSGSSLYAAECVAPALQRALGRTVSAVPAGLILTHPETCLPPSGSFLVVSLARSGNSPESRAAVDWLLESRPRRATCSSPATARAPSPPRTRHAAKCAPSCSTRRRTTAAW